MSTEKPDLEKTRTADSTPLDRRTLIATAAVAAAGAALPSVAAAAPAHATSTAAEWGLTRFAVNVEMWWGGTPFLEKVRKAHEAGFPAIEFWPWRGKPIDELRALSEELSIDIAQFTGWGFVPGLNEPTNHAKFEREIREGIDIAKKLRCPKMTVVGGNDVAGKSPAEMHDAIIAGLRRVKSMVEDAGVMLILEPMNVRVDHKGHCLYGSEDAVRICREVDSPMVKLNWDLYHMQISEGDLCGRLRDGFDQIGYLQIADHPGRHEPGTGEIHYNRVLQEAYRLGYRGYVGLECSPRDGVEKAIERVRSADVWTP